jgi:hypothetical protein
MKHSILAGQMCGKYNKNFQILHLFFCFLSSFSNFFTLSNKNQGGRSTNSSINQLLFPENVKHFSLKR